MGMIGRKLVALAVGAALGGVAGGAVAGGFAIGTQSGSGTGNAFAGGAAAADDASVAWFNPALMTLLPGTQVAGALNIVKPSFKFSNSASTGAFASPPASSSDGGDGGDWAVIPNAFFTMAINPKPEHRFRSQRSIRTEDRVRHAMARSAHGNQVRG